MDTSHKNILLVEDDLSGRRVFKKVLMRAGYEVFEAGSSDEALQFCRQSEIPIQIGIIDLCIPTTSGPILARSIEDICPNIKILFTTGYSNLRLEEKDIIISSKNCLYKPFSPSKLLDKLSETIGNET